MAVSTIQLPKETIELLRKLAKKDDRSMSSYLRLLIAEIANNLGVK